MAADIVVGANTALLIAHNDDAGIRNLTQKIVSRIRNLVGTSGAKPHVEMDGFHLALKVLVIHIVFLWKRSRFRERDSRPAVCVSSGHICVSRLFLASARVLPLISTEATDQSKTF